MAVADQPVASAAPLDEPAAPIEVQGPTDTETHTDFPAP
jgi:hypothetical protein